MTLCCLIHIAATELTSVTPVLGQGSTLETEIPAPLPFFYGFAQRRMPASRCPFELLSASMQELAATVRQSGGGFG